MKKVHTLELAKIGKWGQDGAEITRQDLREVAETFAGKRPAVIGHAETDKAPKFGDVLDMRLSDDGAKIYGDVMFLPEAEALYERGAYSGWSVSIPKRGADGKRYLHHVAFLGATPPKIPGLKDLGINYSEGESPEVYQFSGQVPEEGAKMTDEEKKAHEEALKAEKDKAAALQKQLDALKAEFEAYKAENKAPPKKPEFSDPEAAKKFADMEKKLAEVETASRKARLASFSEAVKGKIPAGLLPKAEAVAGLLEGAGEAEFADADGKPIDWAKAATNM
ncbi:hypothetical protein [Treponema endosymbiont of Eucomonympha sp.]|uniref:hypothetical protein n=1 Tax=Treponema endosymbiont of Eucomonympha sp. TaxID=1580831 RepID=UPI000783F928|nr:hypothetical protein [Treponema endosymbiont of Eucomonympha sp.]